MSSNQAVIITKASGEMVPFSSEKLERSLKRAGAKSNVIQSIIKKVEEKLFPGITTKEIYHIAFEILKNSTTSIAAKYKLKHAIMELGPSGFPFERYVAQILKHQGFNTWVGEIIKGHCVSHEIDIIAEKEGEYHMMECKFHHQSGYMSDVKIPLYIQSRFKDVENAPNRIVEQGGKFSKGWVVTNTKFSADAIQYGGCVGLQLMGWDHPTKGSLRERIDNAGLYPVTCLTTLTQYEKSKLLDLGVVLVREINGNPSLLNRIGIPQSRVDNVLNECAEICSAG